MTAELLVVGAGKMGAALAGGLLAAGRVDPGDVVLVDASAARREELQAEGGLAAEYPGVTVTDRVVACRNCVLAVKPGDVAAAAKQVGEAGVERVMSIAAGVTLGQLEAALSPATAPVIRVMPNTPALVGQGAAGLAGGSRAAEEDLAWAEATMGAVGIAVRLPESALDAVTGLSGSGPAYVFLVVEALIDAGVLAGLSRAVAKDLAVQTVLGAAALLKERGEEPSALRAAVTSPGGTTAAGLRALEAGGVRAAVMDAVMVATERSRQLGA